MYWAENVLTGEMLSMFYVFIRYSVQNVSSSNHANLQCGANYYVNYGHEFPFRIL